MHPTLYVDDEELEEICKEGRGGKEGKHDKEAKKGQELGRERGSRSKGAA